MGRKSAKEAAAAAKSHQSCLTLCNSIDGSSPGSSVPGILQARTLEWVRKTSTFALLTMPKPLTLWITTNCGKFWKRWEYETTWPASWEISMLVKKQLHMEQQTGSKSGKEYVKAAYCYPVYLTSMQSTSCEMPGWTKRRLDSRLQGEISITSDMQMTPPLWQNGKN